MNIHLISRIKRKIKQTFSKKIPIYIPIFQGELMKNKTVLVTGGTSGIGFAIAKEVLLNKGNVIITGRSEKRIEKACNELKSTKGINGEIYGFVMDNSDIGKQKDVFESIISNIDGKQIDVLVNNAGLVGGNFGDLDEKLYDNIMNTNLKGTFFMCQIVANYMKKRGIQGNILNVASSSSLRPAYSAYTLSKWGIRGLTLGLAKALIPYGIVVNGIAPGATATPMLTEETNNLMLPTSPEERYADAQEIANMAVMLMSDTGRMVVGDILYMTGGSGLITFDDIKYNF